MFSISSLFRKKPSTSAFQELKVDMHSHLIPGIDDGSPDLATSISFIKSLHELGYEKIITTPHIMVDLYPNDSVRIRDKIKLLRKAISEANITIKLEAAAEYFVDKHFDMLVDKDDILSFGKKRYVLIEMSFVSISPNIEDVIFALVARGYQPILAHPERYTYLINRKDFYKRINDLGCMLQVNILSLIGYYGKAVQSWAFTLVKSDFVHFLGTDLHHKQHLEILTGHQFDRKLLDIVSNYPLLNQELLN